MADEVETQTEEAPKSLSLLASEMYGEKFVGEVKENVVEDTTEDAVDPELDAETDVETGETADTELKTETEPESGTESKTVEISTIDELVSHYELDPEWVKTLKTSVQIDHVSSEVSIDDLVASYQQREAADRRLEKAKIKAEEVDGELVRQREFLNEQAVVVASMIKKNESVIDQEAQEIDWKQLREDDPAEYSAKKADFAERRERVDRMKQEAVGEYQKALQQQQENVNAQQQQRVQTEHAALLEKLPEWRDEKKAKTEKTEIAEYLMGQGFSQNDVAQATDHRIILLARKALLYDRNQKKADVARKKVVKIPKVVKPGSPKPAEQRGREQIVKLEAKLKATGKMSDAFALMEAKSAAQR